MTTTADARDIICRIANGDLDAEIVTRTEHAIAFLDHRPVFHGHTLVAPLRHVETLSDISAEALSPVMELVQRLATAMVTGLGAQGSFVGVNNVVSQSVPHLHVHVIPRTKGDGLRGFFWPRRSYAAGQAAAYAARLREALQA
ncbi:MAG TPA: HIT family protein [Propionibacteriaceae bacterium]|nr:HIT family protein [Propionibacteriaceae bacterium]